jgi:hypothetical protein
VPIELRTPLRPTRDTPRDRCKPTDVVVGGLGLASAAEQLSDELARAER